MNGINQTDPGIRSSTSHSLFRNALLKSIRPVQRKTFNINDSVGFKLLTRSQLGFSHLPEHQFRLMMNVGWVTTHTQAKCHFGYWDFHFRALNTSEWPMRFQQNALSQSDCSILKVSGPSRLYTSQCHVVFGNRQCHKRMASRNFLIIL